MANKKNTPVKRRYTKKSAKPEPDNKELLGLVLEGVNRLSLKDKAQVFAYILGKDQLDENQLWAVEKILS